jgi:hypothetical protein
MTPSELAQAAADALAKGLQNVQLVLPRSASGRRRMVVFKKPRIYGEVCCENADGRTVVWVDALDLLAYLAAAGLIEVRTTSGEVISRG